GLSVSSGKSSRSVRTSGSVRGSTWFPSMLRHCTGRARRTPGTAPPGVTSGLAVAGPEVGVAVRVLLDHELLLQVLVPLLRLLAGLVLAAEVAGAAHGGPVEPHGEVVEAPEQAAPGGVVGVRFLGHGVLPVVVRACP